MDSELLRFIHCKLLHTNFAEDILRIKLEFNKKEKYLESKKIDTKKLEYYDDSIENKERYFRSIEKEGILKQGNVYYIIENHNFIIPLEDIEFDKEAVKLGILGDKTKTGRWSKEETIEDMLYAIDELKKADYPITLNLF